MNNKNNKRQKIMVIERKILFQDDYFEGFKSKEESDFERKVLENHKYMDRDEVEFDPEYKQPIPYSLIVNPALKKFFVYQRAGKSNYGEKRLQEKWSLGVGGHIDEPDEATDNPIITALLRELREEVKFHMVGDPQLLGFINTDENSIGQVHFGFFYLVKTNSEKVSLNESALQKGKLMSFEEAEKIFSDPTYHIENWSRIVFEYLRQTKSLETLLYQQ